MSIGKKTATGLVWTFSQQFISIGINFGVSVLLARLMQPSQFGLMGMVAIFMAVGEALTNGGLVNSLIRTENPDQVDYSTVFYANLAASLLIYGIVFVSAPLIAAFFRNDALVPIVRVYMLCIILYAFAAVPATKLTKELHFKRLMIYHIPSLVISGLTGILLAYNGYGVWSLVWMNLVQAVLYGTQLWIRSRWLPSLVFDAGRLKEHFLFGSRLLLSAILDKVYANVYNMVIGRFYSAAQLGYYTRSYTLVQIPAANLSDALNKVSFPVLSSIQHETDRLAAAYGKLTRQALFIIMPVLTMMLLTAEPLFRLLLTEKWLPAVPYFKLLCIAGILNTVNGYNLTLLLVKGRSDLYLKLNLLEKLLVTGGILAVASLGIYGLLYFQVLFSIVIYLINGYVCGRLLHYTVFRQILDLFPTLGIACLAGLGTYGLGHWLPVSGDFTRILELCVFYTGLYIILFLLFNIREPRDFYTFFLKGCTEKLRKNHVPELQAQ